MTSRSGLCFGSLQMGEALSAPPPPGSRLWPRRGKGEAAGASLQKEYFGCGGCGAGASPAVRPAPARRLVSVRCAYPRFHVAPRSMRSAAGGPQAPSQRGAGRGCGAGGTSDSVLLARRLHGAQCHSARMCCAHSPPRAASPGEAMPSEP